jgi:histidine triad (HIT) family protein
VDGCPFCDIAAGRSQAAFVARDELSCAFLDHAPLFPGHTLVMPREHVTTLDDLPPGLVEPFFTMVARSSRAVRIGTGSQGTFVAMNNVVSQSVPHLHAHVVPRTKGDGLRGFWPRTRYRDGAHLEEVRAAITAAFDSPGVGG